MYSALWISSILPMAPSIAFIPGRGACIDVLLYPRGKVYGNK